MKKEQTAVKEFKGKPDVYVINEGAAIGVTTSEHMKAADIPLEHYIRQAIEEARQFGDSIIQKYDYPDGHFLP